MFIKSVRVIYAAVAWLFVAAILSQVFLAGLGLFVRRAYWGDHMGFGHAIGLAPLLLIILSFLGRLSRRAKGLTGLAFGVYFVQAEVFAGIRSFAPGWTLALHPVLGFVLLALAFRVAQEGWRAVQTPEAEPSEAVAKPEAVATPAA